jgi:hypothetical protein
MNMTHLAAHRTLLDQPDEFDPKTHAIATIHPASAESVQQVLAADENDGDGRSQWVWVRLANGDLVLGLYPQGDTYFACEHDAQTPEGV